MFRKEDYWIRPRKKLLEYQIGFFNREIKRVERGYKTWLTNMPKRMERFKPRYQSREEIDEAYLAGLLTKQEYSEQRNAYRMVYSDYGSKMKLAWLRSQLDQYSRQYDALIDYMDDLRQKSEAKAIKNRRIKRRRHNKRGYYAKTRERMAIEKEIKLAEQKAREEACKYWKHIYDDVESDEE